jgi:hypothetical protein
LGKVTYRVRILAEGRRTGGDDVGRVEFGEHGVGLAGVDDVEEFVEPRMARQRCTDMT